MAAIRRFLVPSLLVGAGLFVGYHLGIAKERKLEEVVENTYRIRGPDKQPYLVNFRERTVWPEYSSLEDIFGVEHGR
ncbi:hypothetical protein J4419_04890 [Candidatus Woesearchaeota archaeon]|nr:hypothetical protein [Candidatus Woesearchaeota archaeon]